MLAAPAEWCPNPSSIVSLRVKGNSMSPLILDGYIISVDISQVTHNDVLGQIVVAWNTDKGLLVSRLMRFDHTDALVPDQRGHESISLAAETKWRIVGTVLWWTGRSRQSHSRSSRHPTMAAFRIESLGRGPTKTNLRSRKKSWLFGS